jgi:branched-chain amino acid transport system permease protein
MTQLFQAVLNGLMGGALIAIPAIGFSAIFAVLRYPNFAVASYATIGAFAGWWVNTQLGLPVVAMLVVAFLVAGVVGVAAEEVALKRLRPGGAITVAVASLALNLILENLVRFAFGNDLRGYDLPIARDIHIFDLRIGPQQVQSLLLALAIMAVFFVYLRFTRFGKAMRAVADNPDLARLKGIDPVKIAIVSVFIGAGFSGVGGVLIGLDTSIDPLTGYRVLLSVFAAAVLGGLGSIPGAVAGALVLAVAEELAMLVAPATYRTAVGFFAILIMLTFRPRGILGDRAT